MDHLVRFQWLNIATKGIASGKERSAVYDELYDHIEDHMDALLAAGFSRELAEEQAISAMGDPYDVSRQLRKVYQPILTWILRVCKGALACSLTLWLLYAWVNQPFEQRLLDIIESMPIPLFDNTMEEAGNEDIKAVLRDYAKRVKEV